MQIDFLRRNVDKLLKDSDKNNKNDNELESMSKTISKLEDKLSVALSRISYLEKSSKKQSGAVNDMYYSEHPPTLITRIVSHEGL